MIPNSSKNLKLLTENQLKSVKRKTESTLDVTNKERNLPHAIINFINKKIIFESKFDEEGSDKFLLSKDLALCDFILDDEIEEDENESYNSISFMKKFTFNKEKYLIKDEENLWIKNPFCYLLNRNIYKSYKLCDKYYNLNEIEQNKETKIENNFNY